MPSARPAASAVGRVIPETFYQFSSFNQPPTIFRLDLRTGAATPFAVPKVPFNPDDYVVEQRSFPSKDGTKVPMYIVRAKALAQAGKAAPTLLYGYGGFDIALTPGYSAVRMAWLRSGGVFALANIRGGGEFGPAWYEAGRLAGKQNSFDDFIAAGEFLLRERIVAKGGLAIQGGSNGGMMVGAVINQRPDLFAAANPDVGVMDMLRFDRFTQGRFWTDDYGSPAREADWRCCAPIPLSQHPRSGGLSGNPRHHRRYRRPRRACPQLQICCGAAGGLAGDRPHPAARGSAGWAWPRKAGRQGNRDRCRRAGVPREMDGA